MTTITAETYTLPTVEAALTAHLETWLSDFLAMTERAERIHAVWPDHYGELAAGAIPRPELFTRRNEWPTDLTERVPMVVLVTGDEKESRRRGDVTIATFEFVVGVVCGGDGAGDVDAGNVARAYYRAVKQLLDSRRTFGLAGAKVVSVGVGVPATQAVVQSTQIAVAQVPVRVEFPFYRHALDVNAAEFEPTAAGQVPPAPAPAVTATTLDVQVDSGDAST